MTFTKDKGWRWLLAKLGRIFRRRRTDRRRITWGPDVENDVLPFMLHAVQLGKPQWALTLAEHQ